MNHSTETPVKQSATDIEAQIIATCNALFQPGEVAELRILGMPGQKWKSTAAGWFDEWTALAKAAAHYDATRSPEGIYVTLNPVHRGCLARAADNEVIDGQEPTTSDKDILRRQWLPIDIEYERPSKISSTDVELAAADSVADAVALYLESDLGFYPALRAMSGNGYHLLYSIDLPNDPEALELVKQCLAALGQRFNSDKVKIDQTMSNAARINKLWGTMARKGRNTTERPHRRSQLLTPRLFEQTALNPIEHLRALAATLRKPARTSSSTPRRNSFDLEQYIEDNRWTVKRREPWQGGERFIVDCVFDPSHNGTSAAFFRGADGTPGYKCQHNSCHDKKMAEVLKRYPRKDRVSPRTRQTSTDIEVTPEIVNLNDVEAEEVNWLWPNRIALGKVTLIAGDPGLGKSFLTLDMTARVTTGTGWPDGPNPNPPMGVVLMSAEDDVADTIKPRLLAAGADCKRVIALQGKRVTDDEGNTTIRPVTLQDIPFIEEAIVQTPDCGLGVVDPISAFLGKADSHVNAEVRAVLAGLSELASRKNVAIVAVTHLRKGEGPAIYRALGSLGFVAAARASWGVVKDKDDPTGKRRLLLTIKNNLAEDSDGDGLAFNLIREHEALAARVNWLPGRVSKSIDDVLAKVKPGPDPEERDKAEDWLRDALADGPQPSRELIERAKETASISEKTLRRAKEQLRVEADRDGAIGPWSWRLPDSNR